MKLTKMILRCVAWRDVGRCSRCGGALVARVARARPVAWCRCPVRRAMALGA